MTIIGQHKKLFLISLFLLSGTILFAQGVAQIKGRVLDSETGSPVPFANVFFNNTSIGTIADSLGNYWLKGVPTQYTDLVFSSVGYESFLTKVSLSAGQVLNVQARLRQAKQLLNEFVVKGTRDKQWKKQYDRFIVEFWGKGPNASFCEIQNAGILTFSETEDSTLKAFAQSPLEIYNHALGYKIMLDLKFFEMSANAYRTTFYVRFTELSPKNEREVFRWQIGRLRSYKGSQRHFLKSLIDKRAHEEGFSVYYSAEGIQHNRNEAARQALVPVPSDILFPDVVADIKLPGYYKLLRKGTFEIHYLNKITPTAERWYPEFPYPVSWLTVPDQFLLCPLNGIVKSNSNSTVSGNMDTYRVADILPENYDPVPEEGKAYLARYADLCSIHGSVTDSTTAEPLAGAHIFINNSMYKTDADYKGHFKLENIPQGVYDLVTAYGNYPLQSRSIKVNGDSISVQVRLAFMEKDPWVQNPDWQNRKLDLFTKYFVGWSPSVKIINPNVIELNVSNEKIQMRTGTTLEIEDTRTGYKMHYYLKSAELTGGRNEKRIIHGFTSFDTLAAKNIRQREKWQGNRYEFYHGSINHFLRSLTEGRAKEEGFEIYSANAGIPKDPPKRNRAKKKKTPSLPLDGDSLLAKVEGKMMFKLNIPENTTVRFRKDKVTRIESDSGLWVSRLGILASEKALRMNGPMEKKEVPIIPVEYVPLNETISDPKVWVFIQEKEIKSVRQLREKAYLHTDKGYYYPGEKIWYKAYMRYTSREFKENLSKVLHVELISPDKQVIRNEMLKIEDRVAWGDLALPDTLKPGNYYLRAYTRWSLNFGDEYIFTQLLPVLSTEQNIEYAGPGSRQVIAARLLVIQPDLGSYKPRDQIKLRVKFMEPSGAMVHSNLSVSVTDVDKISQSSWVKSIVEDSLLLKKEDWKYKRVSYLIEKELSYDCKVIKGGDENPASVVIFSAKDKQVYIGRPDKDARFEFHADFYDTASFIFRSNTKNGSLAGHVMIEKPYSPPFTIPASSFKLLYRPDNAIQRIKYSYDPSEKSTLLGEVIVRSRKIEDQANQMPTTTFSRSPNYVFQGKALNNLSQSFQDLDLFMKALAAHIPGAQYDIENQTLFLRNSPATIRVNNVPYPPGFLSVLNPIEIERLEVYTLLAIVNVYLKNLEPDEIHKVNPFDRYTLSGYTLPSRFYMRDYNNSNMDNALPDLRTTIYWAPNVIMDGEETTVSFYAADLPTKYRIIVEGLSDNGQSIYGEQIIEVRQ